MEDTRYVYAVARIRALEKKLLTSRVRRELLEAEGEEILFRTLRAAAYGLDKESFEEKLREESAETISLLKKLSLDTELTDLLTLKYDFHNLKILLKAKHFQQDVLSLMVEGGTIGIEELRRALREKRVCTLPAVFADAIEKAEAGFEKDEKTGTIDIIVDREFRNVFHRRCVEYGHRFFTEFSVCIADLLNIRNFFRVRNLGRDADFLERILLENGSIEKNLFLSSVSQQVEEFISRLKSSDYCNLISESAVFLKEKGTLLRMERLIEEYVLDFAGKARYVVFGPEPVFAYSVLKENELKSIRAIVLGKINRVPVEVLKERIPL